MTAKQKATRRVTKEEVTKAMTAKQDATSRRAAAAGGATKTMRLVNQRRRQEREHLE